MALVQVLETVPHKGYVIVKLQISQFAQIWRVNDAQFGSCAEAMNYVDFLVENAQILAEILADDKKW